MTATSVPSNSPVVGFRGPTGGARRKDLAPVGDFTPLPLHFRGRGFALGGWVALISLSIAAALKLGWVFPPTRVVVGESYVLGFNNFVATAVLGAGLVLTLGWLLMTFRQHPAAAPWVGLLPRLFDFEAAHHGSRGMAPWRSRLGLGYLVAVAAILGFVALWYLIVQGPYFGESIYFLPRIELLIEGLRPYRDFEFGYGPFLIYPVFWLYKIYRGLLAIEAAYASILLLQFALGFWALWYVVARLRISSGARLAILLGQCLFWCNLSLGLQYTPLRFIYPLFALCHAWSNRAEPRLSARRLLRWKAPVMALGLPTIGFGISPETGIITCLSLAVLHGWTLLVERRTDSALSLGLTLGSLPLVATIFGTNYFHTILAFGSGGCGFPILPLPYIFCFLGLAFVLIPVLAFHSLVRPKSDNAPFFAALAISLGLGLPAALGRCDPGHIAANGMPLVLLAVSLGSLARTRWQRWFSWSSFAVILLTALISFWSLYWDEVIKELRDRAMTALILPHRLAPRQFDPSLFDAAVRAVAKAADQQALVESHLSGESLARYVWAKPVTWDARMLPLLDQAHVGTPLGCDDPNLERFLKVSGRYVSGYHVAPADNVFSAPDVERKVRDLAMMPAVLVPKRKMGGHGNPVVEDLLPAYQKFFVERCRWMNRVLVSWWPFVPTRLPFNDVTAIRRAIQAGYVRTGEVGEYDLYVRTETRAPGDADQASR